MLCPIPHCFRFALEDQTEGGHMKGRRNVLAALAVVATRSGRRARCLVPVGRREAEPACGREQLHVCERHQARDPDSVRQHAFPAGPRKRPVGPRADAAPAELHPRQRHPAHERPHGSDLAHRDGDPVDADRRLPRSDGAAGLEQLPLLQAGRHDPQRGLVRLLDGTAVRSSRTGRADGLHARDDQRERQDRAGPSIRSPRRL